MFVVCCLRFAGSLLFVVCVLLVFFVVRCSLFDASCLLFVVCCLLCRCSSFVACRLSFVVFLIVRDCCVLFVVCCSFGVCRASFGVFVVYVC